MRYEETQEQQVKTAEKKYKTLLLQKQECLFVCRVYVITSTI